MKDFEIEDIIIGGVILLFFAFIGLAICDFIFAKPEILKGEIVDRHYKAESSHIGTGTGIGTNGGITTVTTYEVDPEEFLLMVKDDSSNVITVECSPRLYYQKKVGRLNGVRNGACIVILKPSKNSEKEGYL